MYFFGRETYGKCVVSFFNVVTVLRDFATTRCLCCSASACVENKHKKTVFLLTDALSYLPLILNLQWGWGGTTPLPSPDPQGRC